MKLTHLCEGKNIVMSGSEPRRKLPAAVIRESDMIVSEAHRQLLDEGSRLFDRLGVALPGTDLLVPPGAGYLFLIPVLHAIVDRLAKLELEVAHNAGRRQAEEPNRG